MPCSWCRRRPRRSSPEDWPRRWCCAGRRRLEPRLRPAALVRRRTPPRPTLPRAPVRRPVAPHAAPGPFPTPPISPPAWVAAVAITAAAILFSVTFPIFDTDQWQHLAVGRVIWARHHVPTEQLWSWPTWGQPDVTSSYSWLF